MIWKHILLITFLNEPKLILLLTFKLFKILQFITNNSIKRQSFIYAQLNHQKDLFQTIQLSLSRLFAFSVNANQFCLNYG